MRLNKTGPTFFVSLARFSTSPPPAISARTLAASTLTDSVSEMSSSSPDDENSLAAALRLDAVLVALLPGSSLLRGTACSFLFPRNSKRQLVYIFGYLNCKAYQPSFMVYECPTYQTEKRESKSSYYLVFHFIYQLCMRCVNKLPEKKIFLFFFLNSANLFIYCLYSYRATVPLKLA